MSSDISKTTLKQVRREKILDAAERLFIADGFRGVTMEALAAAAHISKATLYGYFPDKEHAFITVATRFAGRVKTAFNTALNEDGALENAVANALIAKHKLVYDTVHRSVHAQDLFNAKDQIVADTFAKLDQTLEGNLAAALAKNGIDRKSSAQKARIIFHAALGLSHTQATPASVARDIRFLVAKIL